MRGDDEQSYALKEVYMKNLDRAVKMAYVNEIKLLRKLKGHSEIITLYDW